eukprot:243187-Chlamydomonas_euryale.AAC.4
MVCMTSHDVHGGNGSTWAYIATRMVVMAAHGVHGVHGGGAWCACFACWRIVHGVHGGAWSWRRMVCMAAHGAK